MKCTACNGTGKVEDPDELAAALRSERIAANLTLQDIGDVLHLSAPYLSDLERGNRLITAQRAEEFRKAIKIASKALKSK